MPAHGPLGYVPEPNPNLYPDPESVVWIIPGENAAFWVIIEMKASNPWKLRKKNKEGNKGRFNKVQCPCECRSQCDYTAATHDSPGAPLRDRYTVEQAQTPSHHPPPILCSIPCDWTLWSCLVLGSCRVYLLDSDLKKCSQGCQEQPEEEHWAQEALVQGQDFHSRWRFQLESPQGVGSVNCTSVMSPTAVGMLGCSVQRMGS